MKAREIETGKIVNVLIETHYYALDGNSKIYGEYDEDEIEFIKEPEPGIWHDAKEDVGNDRRILVLSEEGMGCVTTRKNLISGFGEWGKGFCRWAYLDDLLKLK